MKPPPAPRIVDGEPVYLIHHLLASVYGLYCHSWPPGITVYHSFLSMNPKHGNYPIIVSTWSFLSLFKPPEFVCLCLVFFEALVCSSDLDFMSLPWAFIFFFGKNLFFGTLFVKPLSFYFLELFLLHSYLLIFCAFFLRLSWIFSFALFYSRCISSNYIKTLSVI